MATEYMNVNLHWFDNFSEEQIGRLVKAAAQYAFWGENTVFEGEERFVWPLIKQALDAAFCGNCTEEIGGNKTVTEDRFDTTDELIRQNKTQNASCISGEDTSFTQNTGCIFHSETAIAQDSGVKIRFDTIDERVEKERDFPLEKDIPPAPPIERDNPIERERERSSSSLSNSLYINNISIAIEEEEREKEKEREREETQRIEDSFNRFWKLYPRKVGKKAARRAFEKVMRSGVALETLVTALERQKCSKQWTKDGVQFVPHPATWLNGERWEDEVEGGANDGFGSSGAGRTEWGLAKSPLECV